MLVSVELIMTIDMHIIDW